MFEEKVAKMNDGETQSFTPDTYEKRVYTVDEIQDILSISKTTAYNLVKQNQFRCVKVGGHYRISKRSFDAWLDSQKDIEQEVCINE